MILLKKFPKAWLLQIPVSIAFGYFIDFSMFLLSWLAPAGIIARLVSLFVGCVILAFGVFIEVIADAVMLPGESFVKAVSDTFNTEFGKTKIVFDSTMTIIAIILCFVFFGKLNGVGIGTVIAALLVGFIARMIGKRLNFMEEKLFGVKSIEEVTDLSDTESTVITISRECGTHAHDIGQALANELDITFYNKNLLKKKAIEEGLSARLFDDDKMNSSYLFDLYDQSQDYIGATEYEPETIYKMIKTLIRHIALNESCIIVGRNANQILKDDKRTIRVFLTADDEDKVNTIMEKFMLDRHAAEAYIKRTEHRRKTSCHLLTGERLNDYSQYDLVLNISKIGKEQAVEAIKDIYLKMNNK